MNPQSMSHQGTLTKIAVFKGKNIRRILVHDQWWFSVIDVVAILSDSDNPRDYWYKMKIREKDEAKVELSTFCRQLGLIFSMLGEAATTEITRVDDAQGFHESKTAARKGGEVAGKARKDLEKKTGKRVVSPENYLSEAESRKRLKAK